MKKAIVITYLAFFILAMAVSCTNSKDCRCTYSVDNEIVDTALWNASGQPIYLKSGELAETKSYIRDTVLYSGECSSLNYYDYQGIYMSQSGVCIHSVVECYEMQ